MMNKAIPLILVALAVLLLVWGVTRDMEEPEASETGQVANEEAETPEEAVDRGENRAAQEYPADANIGSVTADGQSDERVGAGDASDASTEEPRPRRQIVNIYDPEEERQARIEVAREVFGDDGPVTCENACDCEDGSGCQQPAGICVPGLLDTPCCEWDTCPEGEGCVDAEGSSGTCPER